MSNAHVPTAAAPMTRHPCAHPEEPPIRRWGPVQLAQSMILRMARSLSWPSRRAARQLRGAWRTPEFRWCRINARAAASRTKGCRDSPAESPDLVGGAGRYVSKKYTQFRGRHDPTVVAVRRPLGAKARRIPDALHLAQPQPANDRAPRTQGHKRKREYRLRAGNYPEHIRHASLFSKEHASLSASS